MSPFSWAKQFFFLVSKNSWLIAHCSWNWSFCVRLCLSILVVQVPDCQTRQNQHQISIPIMLSTPTASAKLPLFKTLPLEIRGETYKCLLPYIEDPTFHSSSWFSNGNANFNYLDCNSDGKVITRFVNGSAHTPILWLDRRIYHEVTDVLFSGSLIIIDLLSWKRNVEIIAMNGTRNFSEDWITADRGSWQSKLGPLDTGPQMRWWKSGGVSWPSVGFSENLAE